MGRVRNNSGASAQKNEEHLKELCDLMADPNASVKQLNTLYAFRTAWASRGYLLDRELLIVRTNSQGDYISKASQRAAKRDALNASQKHTVTLRDTPVEELVVTMAETESHSERNVVSPEDILKKLEESASKRRGK